MFCGVVSCRGGAIYAVRRVAVRCGGVRWGWQCQEPNRSKSRVATRAAYFHRHQPGNMVLLLCVVNTHTTLCDLTRVGDPRYRSSHDRRAPPSPPSSFCAAVRAFRFVPFRSVPCTHVRTYVRTPSVRLPCFVPFILFAYTHVAGCSGTYRALPPCTSWGTTRHRCVGAACVRACVRVVECQKLKGKRF